MPIELLIQLIGVGALALVMYKIAATTLARASQASAHRLKRRKTLQDFSRQIAGDERPSEQDAPAWQGKRKFVVTQRKFETPDHSVCSFYLSPLDQRALADFKPGQFLTFDVPDATGNGSHRRCYSLSQGPAQCLDQAAYRVTIKKLHPPGNAPAGTPPGMASSYFHELPEGARVDVYAPSGRFLLDQSTNRPAALIAGGVGITPMISMIDWMIEFQPQRHIWLFISVRNRREHIMYETLRELRDRSENVHIVVAYSKPTSSCRKGLDYDIAGRISVKAIAQFLKGRSFQFYICGPRAMMDALLGGLDKWGVPEQDVFYESFGPASPRPQIAPDGSGAVTGPTFAVTFARSNKQVLWSTTSGSLLELAEQNGIRTRSGCRAGNCGTCETRLIDGEIAYSQRPSAKPEAGNCLMCLAQPAGDVVVDL